MADLVKSIKKNSISNYVIIYKMANKRKNIPKDLLKELLVKCEANISQTRKELAKHGYHCHRETVENYIGDYGLETFCDGIRKDIVEDLTYQAINEARSAPDADRQKQMLINIYGDKVGWAPNAVSHRQKLEQIQAQSKADKELEREKMRQTISEMAKKQHD